MHNVLVIIISNSASISFTTARECAWGICSAH